MRRYLLDTAPLAALLLGRPGAASLVTPWISNHEVATSILVYGESLEYLRSFPDFAQNGTALRTLLREIHPYGLTYSILERYADIRRELRRPHGSGLIRDVDTLISATALEQELTVVTTDSDFERVPDLNVLLIDREVLRAR